MWAVAVHGGAGVVSKSIDTLPYIEGLDAALSCGVKRLSSEGSALEAVVDAVESLEDNELFNAGRGSVLTEDGVAELEASVMEGKDLRCGAVCGLRTVKNPVKLARLVMQETPHIFLGFEAAEKFADKFPKAIERVSNAYFITERRMKQFQEATAANQSNLIDHSANAFPYKEPGAGGDEKGTVGAVACDIYGNVACATSTGGKTRKWSGRIGDTPVIGAGSYASNKSGAFSCTGHGEEFLRNNAAGFVSTAMEVGKLSLKDAVYELVHNRLKPEDGGIIAVSPSAEIVVDFNSLGMFHAFADSSGTKGHRIWHDV
ncbi:hypothetical protein GpartN1_g5595.t1 [Galdieria partita]|uniref:beta-aspartyl-peptidase n=1 Tax=Galdieria partita TaxID=83374 RepID=A0A9C7Q0Z0_9RHOD|nr:hypothetical protein GpartN1_g5595.t1 [Galdieria partita]